MKSWVVKLIPKGRGIKKVIKVLLAGLVLIGLTACSQLVQSNSTVTEPSGGNSEGSGDEGSESNLNLDIPTTVHINNMFTSLIIL